MTLYSSSILLGLAIVAQAYLIAGIVDRVFLKGDSLTEVWPLLTALLLAFASRAIFSWLNGRTGIRIASSVKGEVRKKLLNKWAHQPLTASVGSQAGRKVSVLMEAVDGLDGYYSKYVPQRIETTLVPLMILVVLFKEHWFTGLIILITAPFIPIFMALIGVKTKEKSEDQMEKLESFSGTFLDVLQGLTTLKLFGKGKTKSSEIMESSLNFRESTMEVLKTAFLSSLMLEFISMLSIGLIALEVGLHARVGQAAHRHLTEIGTGEERTVDVDRITRTRDDGSVATIEKHPHEVAEAFLRSDGVGDLGLDVEVDVPLALVEIGDRLAQLGKSPRHRVPMIAGDTGRLTEFLDGDRRRRDVGVAESEVDDVDAVPTSLDLQIVDDREHVRRQIGDPAKLHDGRRYWPGPDEPGSFRQPRVILRGSAGDSATHSARVVDLEKSGADRSGVLAEVGQDDARMRADV